MNTQKITEFKNRLSYGISPALATPLSGYEVKADVATELATWLIGKGSKGLFIGGTTGEGITLDHDQRKRLHAAAIPACKQAGGVAMAHVGTNNLRDTIDLATHAAENGADIVSILPGYFYGLSDDTILDYFKTVGETVPQVGLMFYDIPHMAVNGASPVLVKKLCAAVPNFVGLKSSRKDALVIRSLIEALDGVRFILTGNEQMAAGLQVLGAAGMITGLSTAVPEPFVEMGAALEKGDIATAQKCQSKINRILNLTPDGARIAFIKKIITERGFDVGDPIPPRPPTNEHFWERVQTILSS
ncbi:MAG: dihydrodipicolinate synthase/N-acetylneuraminate lyase [Cellvibrionaceae bacterium]|jgi:dihydrodipicolinate synthase/N-acetylneuraminate lyase